jgi:murein L,D-transpeptidase YcbB/YkuD
MTDDPPPEQEAGQAYDAALLAFAKRFQARHGLEQTGSLGPKTLAALNVPVSKRLRQLAASIDRLAAMDFVFGQRYVVVNLPAADAEAIEGNKLVRRYVVQVGRPERPTRPGRCRSGFSRRMSSPRCARTRAMPPACT